MRIGERNQKAILQSAVKRVYTFKKVEEVNLELFSFAEQTPYLEIETKKVAEDCVKI